MDAVRAIDVSETRRTEHHPVAWCRPAKRMRRRIGVMVGLDLDNEAADPVHQQRGADQVGRDLMHAAREKGTLEQLAEGRGRRGGALRTWSHFKG